jgi:hypothetical protein
MADYVIIIIIIIIINTTKIPLKIKVTIKG